MTHSMTDERFKHLDAMLLHYELSTVLYREADLLDRREYEIWLDMLTEDIRYFVPLRSNVKFGEWRKEDTLSGVETAWFDEGKDTLRKRVKQLMTGLHWAEEPVSRVSHLVTNIEVQKEESNQGSPDEVQIRCRFIVYRNRRNTETDFYVGKREDTLRRTIEGWKICRRTAYLDQNVLTAKNITAFF